MLIRRVVLTLFAAALIVPSTAAAIPNTNGGGGGWPDPGDPPVARLAAPDSALQYSNITLDASGSYDIDGTITKYEWDFNGDGAYDRTTTSSHTTAYFGGYLNYTVRVRVTDNDGNRSTASHVIVVHPPPVARFFVAPTQPTAGKDAWLISKDSYASGSSPSFEWDLDGNGTYETSVGRNPEYRTKFATPGAHVVGLRVTDRYGCTATTTLTVTVKRARPADGITTTNGGVLSAK